MRDDVLDLTPDLLMQAYRVGVFPMSESRDDPDLFWVDPRFRGILPLDGFHISRSLARTLRRGAFTVTINTAFADVVQGCADRDETWINATIYDLYMALFQRGDAHSIEVWQDENLVGGVYGVVAGAAFFGESMFSRVTDASKVALACLTKHLTDQGFQLFDTQFITPHLRSLGGLEIRRSEYHLMLENALAKQADFIAPPPSPYDALQVRTQTS